MDFSAPNTKIPSIRFTTVAQLHATLQKKASMHGELIVSMVDSRPGDRICCFHRWCRFFSLPETRSRINGDGSSRVAVAGRESSEGKKFDKPRLCGGFFSLYSLPLSVNRPVDICHENRSACRQTERHHALNRLKIYSDWSIGVSRNRDPIKSSGGTKTTRGEEKNKTEKKKNIGTPTRFSEAVKNTCLHEEPRLGPDQMATGLICMRPLPPGVPEFTYERVALTDFSPSWIPISFSFSLLRFSFLVSSPSVPLSSAFILAFSLLFPPRRLCSTPGVRIYGLLAQRVASLTRR